MAGRSELGRSGVGLVDEGRIDQFPREWALHHRSIECSGCARMIPKWARECPWCGRGVVKGKAS